MASDNKMLLVIVIFVVLLMFFAGCFTEKEQETDEETCGELNLESYCDTEVQSVYGCDDCSVKVLSALPGGGYTVYKPDDTAFQCPMVAPGYESEECIGFEQSVSCLEEFTC